MANDDDSPLLNGNDNGMNVHDVGANQEIEAGNDVVVIGDVRAGPSGSRANGRKRARSDSDDDVLELEMEGDFVDWMEMRSEMRKLKSELAVVKREREFFKSRAHALEPARQISEVHTHDFEVDTVQNSFSYYVTPPFEVNGFSFQLVVRERLSYSAHFRASNGSPECIIMPIVTPTQDDCSKHVLALFTLTQKSRLPNRPQAVSCTASVNRLMTSMTSYNGDEESFTPNEDLQDSRITIRITVYTKEAEMPGGGRDEKCVVIKKKVETVATFHVSASYLGMWSRYFRAYFAADMEEAKTGVYPIKDEDITSDEFQEMLLVIYPTQKEIDVDNYKGLLKLANRFEMPNLTRRVENFLINYEGHKIDKAQLFLLATDTYDLPIVLATLIHRWRDADLLRKELLRSEAYKDLQPATQNMINKRYAEASAQTSSTGNKGLYYTSGVHLAYDDDDDDDV